MPSYTIDSPAKLNLFLNIENKRVDGYHNINSLFMEINFVDQIEFKPSDQFGLFVTRGNVPNDETNLIYKSYKLLKGLYNNRLQNYNIYLKKNIPIYSGLGGGSSNAGTTLVALNNLWNLKLTNQKLEKLGLKIGSDVPFFINKGLQFVSGVGNKLQIVKYPDNCNFVFLLICPEINISTKWAYENVNKYLQTNKKKFKFNASFKSFDWMIYKNDFEGLIISTYPEIGEIKKKLNNAGAVFTSLSGSGSTMFGVFENLNQAQKARLLFSSYHTILSLPKKQLP